MVEALHYAAFTTNGGNPAGVVLDATDLDDAAMLAAAADVGYSECAFLVPTDGRDRAFGVRYFSPRAEVAFCGHATIAAGVALVERIGPGPLSFDTSVGEIVVQTASDDGKVTATLTSVPPRSRPADDDELEEALAALRWTREDLDRCYPPHVANAGVNHLILAVTSRERPGALDYDFDRLGAIMAERDWITFQLVTAERADLFHARNAFTPGGIVEDPATGAAAAALGGHLRILDQVPDERAWIAYEYDGAPLAPSTAARPGCSCRTSASGSPRSGSVGLRSRPGRTRLLGDRARRCTALPMTARSV